MREKSDAFLEEKPRTSCGMCPAEARSCFLTVGKRGFEYSIPGYPVTLPPGILFHLVKVFGESRFMKTITTSGIFKDFIKKTEIRTLLTSGHWGYL